MADRILTAVFFDPTKDRIASRDFDFNNHNDRGHMVRFLSWILNNNLRVVIGPQNEIDIQAMKNGGGDFKVTNQPNLGIESVAFLQSK